jgi:hypothetical protein
LIEFKKYGKLRFIFHKNVKIKIFCHWDLGKAMKIKSTFCKSFYSDRLSNTKYEEIHSFAQNLIIEVISKVNEITIIDFFKNEFQLKTHDFINHICSISIFDIFFSKIYMKTSFLGYNNAILP